MHMFEQITVSHVSLYRENKLVIKEFFLSRVLTFSGEILEDKIQKSNRGNKWGKNHSNAMAIRSRIHRNMNSQTGNSMNKLHEA